MIVLEVENLNKSFDSSVILKDISLSLKEGENLVVMGRSGIGKTVLIKCIIRLIEPDSGKITVYGKDASNPEELSEIRRRVGFLFQGGALYDSLNVRENLEFPLTRSRLMNDKKQVSELVMEVLENVGLKDALKKRPSELSGGMRKRIALARTLILKPGIILYDEPTTGLDPITVREISELIVQMQSKYKASSIIITHDITCAEITSNRILVLQDARFCAHGSFDELKNHHDKSINAYFN